MTTKLTRRAALAAGAALLLAATTAPVLAKAEMKGVDVPPLSLIHI